jgi:hypothetical protein
MDNAAALAKMVWQVRELRKTVLSLEVVCCDKDFVCFSLDLEGHGQSQGLR